MRYGLPRDPVQQQERNNELHAAYDATRRVAPYDPETQPPEDDLVAHLKELAGLRSSGTLTDEEFEAAKARLLAGPAAT